MVVDLISCEACGKQISSAAASCPGCGHPVKPSQTNPDAIAESESEASAHANRVVQAWVAIAVLLVILGFALMKFWEVQPSGGRTSQTETGPVEVEIGQPVEFTRYTVTVDKAVNEPVLGMTRDFESGMDPAELIVKGILKQGIGGGASEGGTLIVVDFTLLNSSKNPLTVEDRPHIQLRDHNGTLLEKDQTKTNLEQPLVGGGKMFSGLNPGMKERGTIVFEVAKDQFNPQTWKVVINGQALVSLASLKAPAEQPGAVDQPITEAPGASETSSTVLDPANAPSANMATQDALTKPVVIASVDESEVRNLECTVMEAGADDDLRILVSGTDKDGPDAPSVAAFNADGAPVKLLYGFFDKAKYTEWWASPDPKRIWKVSVRERTETVAREANGKSHHPKIVKIYYADKEVAAYSAWETCFLSGPVSASAKQVTDLASFAELPPIKLERLSGDELGRSNGNSFQPAMKGITLAHGVCVFKPFEGMLRRPTFFIGRKDQAVVKMQGQVLKFEPSPSPKSEKARYKEQSGNGYIQIVATGRTPTSGEMDSGMSGTVQSVVRLIASKPGIGRYDSEGIYICSDGSESEPGWYQ